MPITDREQKIDQMLMMMELYYSTNKEEPILKLYHKLWVDAEVEALGIACREYMQAGKNKYFPRAGDILDIIESWKTPQGSIEAHAQHQWRLVMQAVRERGEGKGPPVFENDITNTVVRIQFGWQYLCNILSDKLNWEEKRFCEAYNLASEIEPEALQIEATPAKVQKLIAGIGEGGSDKCSCDFIKCERITVGPCPVHPNNHIGG